MYSQILNDISAIVQIDQSAVGFEYLRLLAQNTAKTLNVKYVLIGRPAAADSNTIQTVVVWAGDDFADNISYELKGTPCHEVITGRRVCLHDQNVAALFPDDLLLAQMGVEAYAGAPIVGSDGDLLGLMVLLDDKPIEDHDYFCALIDFVAGRVGGELNRHIFSEEEAALQKVLRDSEQRFSAIFNQTYQYVTILDVEGCILEVNRSALEVAGCEQGDVVGSPIWNTPWWNHDEILMKQVEAAVEKASRGELQRFEGRHIGVDGETVDVDVILKPFVDGDGNITLLIVEAHDVSNLKKLEQKLQHSQKMEVVGTLSGGIAHDFNNLLGGILGYAELAQMEDEVGDTARVNLSGIVTACLRGRDLVSKMMVFSRQEVQEKHPVEVAGLVEEAIGLARASVPSSIEIETSLLASSGSIMTDPVQVQQVLINLCTNSVHAIGDNSGTITITSRQRKLGKEMAAELSIAAGEHLVLSVSDTGCGIPPEQLTRIFDPFYTTKDVGQGTGLGLSVVQGIVESFDGAITVESRKNKGTTFVVYLPLLEADQAQQAPGSNSNSEQAPTKSAGHIMLVEDEKDLLKIGRALLEKMGYRVSAFESSPEAWQSIQASAGQYDAVITDLSMPKLQGRGLAKLIKSVAPTLPVIAWTGYSDNTTKENALSLGFDGFIQKPASYSELDQILKKILK